MPAKRLIPCLDADLTRAVAEAAAVPLVASGGCGSAV